MQRKQKRLYLRSVIEEGLHLCVNEFNINPRYLSHLDKQVSVFPHMPYQKGNRARNFLRAVANNDIETVKKLLLKDPMLVYEFNELK